MLIIILVSTIRILVVSISLNLIFKTAKFLNIAHAIAIAFGAYFIYLFSIQFEFNILIAIVLTLIITTVISLSIAQFIYRPLLKRKAENWQMLIASLGVYIVLQNLISIIWGDSTLSFRTWQVKEGYRILDSYITDVQIITIISCAILLVLSWLFVEKTNIGHQIKAVSSNPQLSRYYGISVHKATLYSFTLSSAMAACVGILIAADTDMTPTMGFNWLLYGVVAMIIGGMGKMRYLLFGALLLATAQHLSAYYLDSKWMNATAYIILIVFLYFKPYGFSGQKLKKQEV